MFGKKVQFINDCIGDEVEQAMAQMKRGDILLLENLRFYKEETNGDEAFAEKLSRLGDAYVNDAFGTCHRKHASTYTVTKYFHKKIRRKTSREGTAYYKQDFRKREKTNSFYPWGSKGFFKTKDY